VVSNALQLMSFKQEKYVSNTLYAESDSAGAEYKCIKIESETAAKTAVASLSCSSNNNCIRTELPDGIDTVVVCKNGHKMTIT